MEKKTNIGSGSPGRCAAFGETAAGGTDLEEATVGRTFVEAAVGRNALEAMMDRIRKMDRRELVALNRMIDILVPRPEDPAVSGEQVPEEI